MKYSKDEKTEAIARLRKLGIRPGAKVYTTVVHVSRSGMSRRIRCYVARRGDITDITYSVARVLGYSMRDCALVVGGCGMDMCFHVVYSLGSAMFPQGGPLKYSNHARQAQERAKGREVCGGYLLHKVDL